MTEVTLESLARQQERILAALDSATGGGTLTLSFLARQQERLVDEIGQMRDDLRVMAAIVQRLDGTMQGLVNEVRASHAREDRLARRVERLEAERSI
jgi:hypothetical protein